VKVAAIAGDTKADAGARVKMIDFILADRTERRVKASGRIRTGWDWGSRAIATVCVYVLEVGVIRGQKSDG
jgi:hypothetical protein